MINESIMQAHFWAVDRNITRTYMEDVIEQVKTPTAEHITFRSMINNGYLSEVLPTAA